MSYKKCTLCGESKELSEFRRDSRLKNGIGYHCKRCSSNKALAWNKANPERHAENFAKWRLANKGYDSERKLAWAKANPERKKAADARYVSSHKDKVLARNNRYRLTNKEKINARQRAWSKANIHKKLQFNAKRRAEKIQRTPLWLTKDDLWIMNEIYALAKNRTLLHGFKWHVDHIIPLQGINVCGLHIPSNLQVIPAILNLMKHNKYE